LSDKHDGVVVWNCEDYLSRGDYCISTYRGNRPITATTWIYRRWQSCCV